MSNRNPNAEPNRRTVNPSAEKTAVPLVLQVVVQCRDEDEQRDVYEEMTGRGYKCRVLSL